MQNNVITFLYYYLTGEFNLSVPPLTPQISICYVHQKLCELADRAGNIDYDPETLRRKILPDHPTELKNFLTKLELYGILSIDNNCITLTPWPRLNHRLQITEKSERFERSPCQSPHCSTSKADRDATTRKEKLINKSGLRGFYYPPAFKTFLKAWPQALSHDQRKAAWNEWQTLDRSQALADISLLILALKTYPPAPKMWPHTWLKKRPWKKPADKIVCKTCCDERMIYGTRSDGTKGAIPCPMCSP